MNRSSVIFSNYDTTLYTNMQYDNMHNRVELNMPEILLVKEFSELVKCERNICKEDPKGV